MGIMMLTVRVPLIVMVRQVEVEMGMKGVERQKKGKTKWPKTKAKNHAAKPLGTEPPSLSLIPFQTHPQPQTEPLPPTQRRLRT